MRWRKALEMGRVMLALTALALAHPTSTECMAGGLGSLGVHHRREGNKAGGRASPATMRMRGGGMYDVASRPYSGAPHVPVPRQNQRSMAGRGGGGDAPGGRSSHHQPQHLQEPSFDRYPRSYPKHEPPRTAQPPRKDTPWKMTRTPNYLHAMPAPPTAPAAQDDLVRFGEVVTVQATEEQTATVIWLHGLGDTGHTWSAVASWLRMGYCKFIFPTAPSQVRDGQPETTCTSLPPRSDHPHPPLLFQPVTVSQGYSMPSWFDFNSLEAYEIDEDMASLQRSVDYLLSLIDREVSSGVPPERILLAGFAQGGVVAINAALQSRRPLGGVLALSTWLPKTLPDGMSAGGTSPPQSRLTLLRGPV